MQLESAFFGSGCPVGPALRAALMSPEMYAGCSSLKLDRVHAWCFTCMLFAPAGLDDGTALKSEDTASFQKVVAGAFPDLPQVDQLVQDSIAGRSGRKGAYL